MDLEEIRTETGAFHPSSLVGRGNHCVSTPGGSDYPLRHRRHPGVGGLPLHQPAFNNRLDPSDILAVTESCIVSPMDVRGVISATSREVTVGTGVGVAVGVGVGVGIGIAVGVGVGASVGMGMGVAVGAVVGVGAGRGVAVGVGTGVGAGVGLGDCVGITATVAVGVAASVSMPAVSAGDGAGSPWQAATTATNNMTRIVGHVIVTSRVSISPPSQLTCPQPLCRSSPRCKITATIVLTLAFRVTLG